MKSYIKIQILVVAFVLIFQIFDCYSRNFNEWLKENPVGATPAEFQALPEYCQCKLYYNFSRLEERKKSQKNQKWQKIFGRDYSHLHHYCWGIIKLERAKASPLGDQKRIFWAHHAVGEFDYVIQRADRKSPFLWMYHQKKGEALSIQYKNEEAQIEFKKVEFYRKMLKNK